MGRFLFAFLLFLLSQPGYCIPTLPLDGGMSNLTNFLSGQISNPVIKTIGLVFDHRPMEPATPLGTQLGLDLGIEVGLVQIPNELNDAFAAQGLGNIAIPSLPSVKELNIHKGLGKSVDLGISGFALQGYLVWAVELKVVVFKPEEGLTWAVRLSRNTANIPVGSTSMEFPVIGTVGAKVDLEVVTWTPQLVLSRQLEFADPYFGFGYQYASGAMKVTTTPSVEIPGVGSVNGSGGGFLAFLGVSLRMPVIGFRLTLEGAYSAAGYNSIGTKIGFSL